MKINDLKIGVIGLGYVGLPLAVEFGKHFDVVGYDLNEKRIRELISGYDATNEVSKEDFSKSNRLIFTSNADDIKHANFFIVTVPTPIDKYKSPDLSFVLSATKTISRFLKQGDFIVYESTVYPGCTEEECVPILEQNSNLKYNVDFFCGYSPERINPGDKINKLSSIKKITSGSNSAAADFIDLVYAQIIKAGTYKASSIKVAEAAKAIENAQRDLNIAFVNELALIFEKLDIDTTEVLNAAGTKWNFLSYKPGLVGGHCIGVDPYYLAHKAESVGHHPQVILSGRRVNDYMGFFVANKILKLLIKKGNRIQGGRLLILGFTFKENCSDIRNTKVIDVYSELVQFGFEVHVYDPVADSAEVLHEYGIKLVHELESYDAIIHAVAHDVFDSLDLISLKRDEKSVIYDVKSKLDIKIIDSRL